MSLTEDLRRLGVDVDEGLERVMGDQSLYEMMLGMFIDAVGKEPIQEEEFDGEDVEELIKRVHMLKGVTGNLSIMPLFNGYTEILSLLRSGEAAQAKAGFVKLQGVQEEIISCIKKYSPTA